MNDSNKSTETLLCSMLVRLHDLAHVSCGDSMIEDEIE
jgi:hypothetical protein